MVDQFVVLIPARGGSKSIPKKNIKMIAGQPLIYWAIDACVKCELISKVYISTDCEIIADCIKKYKKEFHEKIAIVPRSIESASDVATTEDAIMEFTNRVDYENLVFVQCTNPLITVSDVRGAIEMFSKFDSIMSSVIQKRFYWKFLSDGSIKEINHDITKRPRRQDWDGVLAENGSIYIISREGFLREKCRLYGRIGTYIMDDTSYYEIDEDMDWIIVETILKEREKYENKLCDLE